MSLRGYNRLVKEGTVFLLCDVQERFRSTIYKMDHVIQTSKLLVDSSKILSIPCIVTEQYPKALLRTVEEIDVTGLKVFEKTKFSMLTNEVKDYLDSLNRKTAVIFGIESHVCLYQTCLELLENDWHVHVVADGVSSSKQLNREIALRQLEQASNKLHITTAECVLFDLMKDSKSEGFKEVSNLVKQQNEILSKISTL